MECAQCVAMECARTRLGVGPPCAANSGPSRQQWAIVPTVWEAAPHFAHAPQLKPPPPPSLRSILTPPAPCPASITIACCSPWVCNQQLMCPPPPRRCLRSSSSTTACWQSYRRSATASWRRRPPSCRWAVGLGRAGWSVVGDWGERGGAWGGDWVALGHVCCPSRGRAAAGAGRKPTTPH